MREVKRNVCYRERVCGERERDKDKDRDREREKSKVEYNRVEYGSVE